MFKESAVKRRVLYQGMACLISLGFCGLLYALARLVPGVFFAAYIPFSRTLSRFIGFAFSFASFSVAEFLIYGVILFFVGYLLFSIFVSLTRTDGLWAFLRWLADLLFSSALVVSLFMVFWGYNYFSPPLEDRMGLTVTAQPEEKLYETAVWLTAKIEEVIDEVPRDESGILALDGFQDSAVRASGALRELSEGNSVFAGAGLSPAKRVTNWVWMTYAGIGGIYFPLTGECNVNPNNADIHYPYVMLHEMAHRCGFAAEEDANFVAFLASDASTDPAVRYSGYVNAFFYCVARLEDSALIEGAWSRFPSKVWDDMASKQEFAEEFEPDQELLETVSEAVSSLNDSYLTAMNQPDGIKSYGRVADLLIAYHISLFPGGYGAE